MAYKILRDDTSGKVIRGIEGKVYEYNVIQYPVDGLLARYSFDNNNYIDSYGSYNASGNGSFSVGKVNNCWTGDGSIANYITAPVTTTTDNDFSVSMWIKLDIISGYRLIFEVWPSSGNNVVLETENANINTYYYVGGVSKAVKKIAANFNTSTWYFLCFGMKNSGKTIWTNINNGAITGEATGNTSYIGKTSCTIGGRGAANYNFIGNIDQVYIYNKALTTDEITQLYNGGAGI